jgi:hypothetical protein
MRRWQWRRMDRGVAAGWPCAVCCDAIRYAREDLIRFREPVTTESARMFEWIIHAVVVL